MNLVSFEPNRRRTEKKGILLGLSKRFIKRIQRKDRERLFGKGETTDDKMSSLRSDINEIIVTYRNDSCHWRSSVTTTKSEKIYIPKEMVVSLVRK